MRGRAGATDPKISFRAWFHFVVIVINQFRLVTFQQSAAASISHVAFVVRHKHMQHLSRSNSVERSEEHTSELQSLAYLVCRLLLEKKKKTIIEAYELSRK